MYVYFALSPRTQSVKIGHATDVEKRLVELQVGCPDKLELLLTLPERPPFEEHQLHYRFRKYRIRGEWFEYRGDLKQFIENKAINPDIDVSDDSALVEKDENGDIIRSYEFPKNDNKEIHNPEQVNGYTDDCQRPGSTPFLSICYGLYPSWVNRDWEIWSPYNYSPKQTLEDSKKER